MNETLATVTVVILLILFGVVTVKRCASHSHNNIIGFQLFNPLGYNLIVFVVTGLVGGFAILLIDDAIFINSVIDGFNSYQTQVLVVVLLVYAYVLLFMAVPVFNKRLLRCTENKDRERGLHPQIVVLITLFLFALVVWFCLHRLTVFRGVFSLDADAKSILVMRAQLVEAEKGFYLLQRLFIDGVAWIFCLYLAQHPRYRLLLWVLASTLGIYFLMSLTKLNFVLFVLSIFMVRNWYTRFSYRKLFKVGFFTLAMLVVMWALFVRNLNPSYLFSVYSEGLLGRILISEISALYPHLEIFGNDLDFLGISSWSRTIAEIVGIEFSPRSGRIVLESVSPGWVERGFGGVYNTVFFGEAYASFGMLGALLSPFVVLLDYFLVVWLCRYLSYRMAIAFLVHTALNFTIMSGFNDFVWNPFLIIQLVLFLGAQLAWETINRAKKCSS